jgi:hypothetical protein
LCYSRVRVEIGVKIAYEIGGGNDVGLVEGKECALVFLVADYEGDFGILLVLYKDVWRFRERCAVRARRVREGEGGAAKEVWDRICCTMLEGR